MFLAIASLSGTLLVYKKPLVKLIVAPEATLPEGFGTADISAQLGQLAATVPPSRRTLIKAPSAEEPYWTLTGTGGHVELLAIGSLTPYRHHTWLLDVFTFVRKVHVELLAGIAGEWLLLASGVAGLFMSISGLVLWWPTRRSFRWRWVMRPVPARLLLLSHRHSGAVAAVVLVILMTTGAVMLWQKLVGPLLPPVPVTTVPLDSGVAAQAPATWWHIPMTAVPDGWPTYIRLPAEARGEVSIRFRLPGEWHPNGRTSVTIDTIGEQTMISARADQVGPGRHLLNLMYPLHAGYGLNLAYMVLVSAAGVVLLWLTLTGGLSYFKARRARRQAPPPRPCV